MAPRLGAARLVPVAVLLVAAAAPTARAVGLSSPVTVSPPDGSADSPAAAMGPQGRTAVIWDEVTPVGASARAEVDARIGPAPDRLGPVVELAPVELGAGRPEVAVTAAGAALACWNDT